MYLNVCSRLHSRLHCARLSTSLAHTSEYNQKRAFCMNATTWYIYALRYPPTYTRAVVRTSEHGSKSPCLHKSRYVYHGPRITVQCGCSKSFPRTSFVYPEHTQLVLSRTSVPEKT